MLLLAAIILGLAGSLHCAGMCGPLIASVHAMRRKYSIASEVIYHSGRLLVYGIFGLLAGFVGSRLSAFGVQRYVALIAGSLMLLFVIFPFLTKYLGLSRWLLKLRSNITPLIQKHGAKANFALGVLNGLLPCGLVYAAIAGALATQSPWKASLFMITFGLGTVPALLVVSQLMHRFIRSHKQATTRTLQIALSAIALLVLLRGTNLGIPYLSPHISNNKGNCKVDCCSH
jgi:sulfite exporter TauE/SafE